MQRKPLGLRDLWCEQKSMSDCHHGATMVTACGTTLAARHGCGCFLGKPMGGSCEINLCITATYSVMYVIHLISSHIIEPQTSVCSVYILPSQNLLDLGSWGAETLHLIWQITEKFGGAKACMARLLIRCINRDHL